MFAGFWNSIICSWLDMIHFFHPPWARRQAWGIVGLHHGRGHQELGAAGGLLDHPAPGGHRQPQRGAQVEAAPPHWPIQGATLCLFE